MTKQKQRVTLRYEGRVQGVCFRFIAVKLSQSFDITGYVRNQSDGSVELVAEGEEQDIMGLINAIRLSQLSRGIMNERLLRSKATEEFKSFTIRY
jgi:acylphosphatase